MATIYDVSRQAEVSPATVSRVLRGGGANVDPALAERVRRAARDLDYRPTNIRASHPRAVHGDALPEHPDGRGVTYVFDSGVEAVTIAATKAQPRDPVAAREQLVEALNAARLAAGKRPLKTLVAGTGYSVSMLSRVFSGEALPSHDLLRGLAEVLNVEMSTFTTLWMPLWQAAHRRPVESAAKPEKVTAPGPDGFECPACGAWVVNPARHIEWHIEIEGGRQQQPPRLRAAG